MKNSTQKVYFEKTPFDVGHSCDREKKHGDQKREKQVSIMRCRFQQVAYFYNKKQKLLRLSF